MKRRFERIPEYWLTDSLNRSIGQYVQKEPSHPYELENVYVSGEIIRSERVLCMGISLETSISAIGVEPP